MHDGMGSWGMRPLAARCGRCHALQVKSACVGTCVCAYIVFSRGGGGGGEVQHHLVVHDHALLTRGEVGHVLGRAVRAVQAAPEQEGQRALVALRDVTGARVEGADGTHRALTAAEPAAAFAVRAAVAAVVAAAALPVVGLEGGVELAGGCVNQRGRRDALNRLQLDGGRDSRWATADRAAGVAGTTAAAGAATGGAGAAARATTAGGASVTWRSWGGAAVRGFLEAPGFGLALFSDSAPGS